MKSRHKQKASHYLGIMLMSGFMSAAASTRSHAAALPAANQGTTPPAKETGAGASDDPSYVVRSSTKIDFSEASIDGQMKAPEGFFLQGRKSQDMQNLLNLRKNFRRELSGSAAAGEVGVP
jgi:hypothetical protein